MRCKVRSAKVLFVLLLYAASALAAFFCARASYWRMSSPGGKTKSARVLRSGLMSSPPRRV